MLEQSSKRKSKPAPSLRASSYLNWISAFQHFGVCQKSPKSQKVPPLFVLENAKVRFLHFVPTLIFFHLEPKWTHEEPALRLRDVFEEPALRMRDDFEEPALRMRYVFEEPALMLLCAFLWRRLDGWSQINPRAGGSNYWAMPFNIWHVLWLSAQSNINLLQWHCGHC